MSRLARFAFRALALAAVLSLAGACGDDEEAQEQPTAPGADESPQPEAEAKTPPAEKPAPPAPAPAAAAGEEDPEKECLVRARCERKCESECAVEERDRSAFFAAKRARVSQAPFEVRIDRAYLDGSCHSGDKPEKRRDANGIAAVVEGELTYEGDDILYAAEPVGRLFLVLSNGRYAEAPVAERKYSYFGRSKPVSKLSRSVRGSDPWFGGQAREFHWESRPIDPVYCEVLPRTAEVYFELATLGVRGGRRIFPTAFVPVFWDEVAGMAVRKQVSVLVRKGKETTAEPADAHYAKLDRVLATRLTGKTEWLKRSSLVHGEDYGRGAPTAFPIEAKTPEWKIRATAVSDAREFGGYAPGGEDQFLAVVDVSVTYSPPPPEEGAEPAPIVPKGFSFRLETSPGKWKGPATKAMGQIDTSAEIAPGGTVSGKVVFPRQRFERPFRLQVKTPDKETVELDVFSYELGPERGDPGDSGP